MKKLIAAVILCISISCADSDKVSNVNIDSNQIDDGNVTFPPELVDLENKIAQAQKGIPVDFNNDGIEDFQISMFENGETFIEIFSPEGNVHYQKLISKSGEYVIYQDVNKDGMTDYSETLEFFPQRIISYSDLNFDGFPEERYTVTFDEEQELLYILKEHGETSTGDYIIVSEKKENVNGFLDKNLQKVFDRKISIGPVDIKWEDCTTTGDKNVAFSNGLEIAAAVSCALSVGLGCLEVTNNAFYGRLIDLITSGKTLTIACNDPDDSELNPLAWTPDTIGLLLYALDIRKNYAEIMFNRLTIDSYAQNHTADSGMCNVFIHELLHVVQREIPEGHDEFAIDRIYSCGRYCSGCSQTLKNAPDDPHADCLRCAQTIAEKETCGYFERTESIERNDEAGVCHSGLGCILGACEKSRHISVMTCEEKIFKEFSPEEAKSNQIYESTFICCEECPDYCDSTNDYPCYDIELRNTCFDALPMCSKK